LEIARVVALAKGENILRQKTTGGGRKARGNTWKHCIRRKGHKGHQIVKRVGSALKQGLKKKKKKKKHAGKGPFSWKRKSEQNKNNIHKMSRTDLEAGKNGKIQKTEVLSEPVKRWKRQVTRKNEKPKIPNSRHEVSSLRKQEKGGELEDRG